MGGTVSYMITRVLLRYLMTKCRGRETPICGTEKAEGNPEGNQRDGGWVEVPGFLPRDGLPCTRLTGIHSGLTAWAAPSHGLAEAYIERCHQVTQY